MTLTYCLLGVAIVTEVTGTLALRASNGFSRPLSSVAVVLCYTTAFVALSFVLKRGMSVAVAYAIWSAIGIITIALIGALFLKQPLTTTQIIGLLVVVVGVVTLELGTGFAA